MEGKLQLYSGIFTIYHDRYCILADDIITVCYEKGGDVEGRIYLGVNKIESDDDNQLLTLSNGYHRTTFRFEDKGQLRAWKSCLRQRRRELLVKRSRAGSINGLEAEEDQVAGFKQFNELRGEFGGGEINKQLAGIWIAQARLSNALNEVYLKIPKESGFLKLSNDIEEMSTELKVRLD